MTQHFFSYGASATFHPQGNIWKGWRDRPRDVPPEGGTALALTRGIVAGMGPISRVSGLFVDLLGVLVQLTSRMN
jgi:hypothetical protein